MLVSSCVADEFADVGAAVLLQQALALELLLRTRVHQRQREARLAVGVALPPLRRV